jgi:hypothetical protein
MPTLSNARRNAAAAGHTDALDSGSGPGLIRIYSGSKPAGPDTAISGQILLAEFTLADPAFTAGATGVRTLDATPVLATDGLAAGTAAWYRALSSDGVAHFDGTVSDEAGAGELKLNTTTISVGLDLQITAGSLTQPA